MLKKAPVQGSFIKFDEQINTIKSSYIILAQMLH